MIWVHYIESAGFEKKKESMYYVLLIYWSWWIVQCYLRAEYGYLIVEPCARLQKNSPTEVGVMNKIHLLDYRWK